MIRIRTPKDAALADLILYRDILESIKFEQLRLSVRRAIDVLGAENALKFFQETVESDVLGRAIYLLGFEEAKREVTANYSKPPQNLRSGIIYFSLTFSLNILRAICVALV